MYAEATTVKNTRARLQALRLSLAVALLCALQSAEAAQFILLPQGSVTLIRTTTVFNVDAPMALEKGDLLATGQGGGQLQAGGTIVAIGADTRIGIDAAPDRDCLALLSGWIKVSRTQAAAAEPLSIDTTGLDIAVHEGAAVLWASREAISLFIETGSMTLSLPDRADVRQMLDGDQYAVRESGKSLDVSTRAPPPFIAAMPLPFRDSLASVPTPAKGKLLALSQGRPATFADLEAWLMAPLAIRRSFVARFGSLARGEPFRSQLRQHLRDLPAWRRVLYPPPAALRRRPFLPVQEHAIEEHA